MTTVAQPTRITDPTQIAGVLVEALPYITRLAGQVVVVKYGGNAMVDESLARQFAEDVVLLQRVGAKPVIVHGGGPQIGDLLARLGKESVFHDGLRVTDAETLEAARMVLAAKINNKIVAGIHVHRPPAHARASGGSTRGPAASPQQRWFGDDCRKAPA